jgi:hypothetical protein
MGSSSLAVTGRHAEEASDSSPLKAKQEQEDLDDRPEEEGAGLFLEHHVNAHHRGEDELARRVVGGDRLGNF